jgi:hypothetical protein
MPSRCSCQIGQQRQWELPGTDPDGTDGSEDRIYSDRADDSTDSDGSDGSEDRIDSDRADDSTDSNGTDGSEDRVDSDRADDSTDSDGSDGSDYRSDGNTAERNRVPDPTDAAFSKIGRCAGRRGEHRKGKCTRHQGETSDRHTSAQPVPGTRRDFRRFDDVRHCAPLSLAGD